MAKTIETAVRTIVHPKCNKEIARVVNGVLYVQCIRRRCKEWVPLEDWVQQDPLDPYRRIQGLIVIGPAEIEQAFLTADGGNPLDLKPGWCPRIPVPYSVEQIKKLVELCQTREWRTTPVLWLALPEVGGQPTSFINQYKWWGVQHDNMGPGKVRQDVFWSNWYIGKSGPDYNWTREVATLQAQWHIGYELPALTTNLSWVKQQKAASERGLSIATAARDALMLNLVLTATGKYLRLTTYARTSTIYEGEPLDVSCSGESVHVDRNWNPDDAYGYVGAALEGVPLKLGT